MLVGYVSNERYVALADMLFEFRRAGRITTARSTISGAVYADIEPGEYEVVLGGPGHGSKIVRMEARQDQPYQFRLLSDGLLGYMWPKCVRGGELAEFRVHGAVEYELELWRYGAAKEFIRRIGTFDEHGPRANMQITPDGDYTQTGVQWNKHGYHSKALGQFVEAPQRSGPVLHARPRQGRDASFPSLGSSRRPNPRHRWQCWPRISTGTRTIVLAAAATTSTPIASPQRRQSTRASN